MNDPTTLRVAERCDYFNGALTIGGWMVWISVRSNVPYSVLDAIKAGKWNFEPESADADKFDSDRFEATNALPGSNEKLEVLATRVAKGLPLWHPGDRRNWEHSVHGKDDV